MQSASAVVAALMECIALPSPTPPGEVAMVADWVEAWARRFEARVERQTVEPGKDNVLITLEFGEGPCLLFNTHMDVNNPTGQVWTYPPFEPVIRENRVYGLGSCDAKGSLVAMLAAMERLALRSEGLRGKLILTAVMGEEAGGIGSLHLVKQGIRADGAIVGEPTQLEAAIAHKGTYMRKIRFRGRAAHSGSPHLGINAIVHASRFCMEYERLNKKLLQFPHPELGPANAAVTILHGGTRQNTIPENAELIADRRLIPGETHQDADRELEEILSTLKADIPELHVDPIEVIVATVPSQTDRAERIVTSALQALEHVTGSPKRAQGFSAGCDMSKLVTIAGIPTVILGPGSLAQAHAPDEFVEIAQVEQAVDVYEQIARLFLKG